MNIRILWQTPCGPGHLELRGGTLAGSPHIPEEATSLEAEIQDAQIAPGDFPTLVRVMRGEHPFTFFLRDVSRQSPLWYPLAQCAVTTGDDSRSYAQVVAEIQEKGLLTDARRMEREPEESYEGACARSTKDQDVPVWLGVARDTRFFRVNRHVYVDLGTWGEITVWNHDAPRCLPDTGEPMRFIFEVGPGAHGCPRVTRRLHEGHLPILHVTQYEQTVNYEMTFFATREKDPLSPADLKAGGTDPIQAYSCMLGANLTPAEKDSLPQPPRQASLGDEENAMVCWLHVEAVNVTDVPAYAFYRVPHLSVEDAPLQNGMLHHGEHGVVCVCNLDGQPTPQREMAVLIPARGKVVFDWKMLHSCLPPQRAERLLTADYARHLQGAIQYWKAWDAQSAVIHLPEPPIEERIQAGVLHLELTTSGKAEGDGPLLPTVGVYPPIGTESCPILLFLDSMGLHRDVERGLQWFLERQDERGYINSFADYGSETGPVLWCVAEHYKTTRNDEWMRSILPKVEKSARFLLAQRREAQAIGGLVAGKSSDPDDNTCAFFLNAGIYLGIAGLAEVLPPFSPQLARELAQDAAQYKEDIRRGLEQSAMESPLVPLMDGSWTPALGPWPGANGNVAYHADGGEWFSHGTIFGRLDSGAMALFLTDALPEHDVLADLILQSHQHPHFRENAGPTQPYYFRHDIAHLKRGETKLFLKCFYNQLVSLQDRHTYTFWEHYFHISSHKTHEEGWFLMQCRWMLALEEKGGLTLLKGIPRAWMEEGKRIQIQGLHTHFGKLDLDVLRQDNAIQGTVHLERKVPTLRIRLPHPLCLTPAKVVGGTYCKKTETLTLEQNSFKLEF